VKNCSPWEALQWRSLWRDPTLEQGQSVRSPCPEEEGVAETCDELTTAPIPCPTASLGERR